ncbi:heavy-metal-associated domain-containing protein [Paracoccus sp. (in: a-proteobacteria)]|uniref:heavy-metal-associated domain-containing protein n=1 Tax=Paracoccus sp. TaxID=267 RepID=UPI0026DFD0FC|nr:heavy metal-associated domain-containing protein [Paracoccus sp. (in: a-proteobacteria)]MDO5646802.1 heavy metal-associated domain-containing protein [Paracoccus sp. (in: a-proteobacteria)]
MILTVSDMTCGHCKAAIETAISDAGGQAVVDLTAKTVTVTGLDSATAESVIRDAGFSPDASAQD